jgi:hypothetical protein
MKNALKLLALLIGFLQLAQFVYPEEKRPSTPRFSLKLMEGWGSNVPIGDVNDCLESFNNNTVFVNYRKDRPDQLVGEIKTLDNRTSHWEAELRFDLTPRIGFGIATADAFHTRNESSVTYTYIGYVGPQIMSYTFKPEIKVFYPMRLSLYYTIFSHPKINLSIGGGFGFYNARVSQFSRIDVTGPDGTTNWSEWRRDTKRNFSLGFHGNVVLEYYLTRRIALVAEFQKRYTRVSSLKGTVKSICSEGFHSEKRGTLYYFTQWELFIGARYASLDVFEKPPEGSIREIQDLRKAVLDLSGHSFRVGIRIRLF